jgi:hypothetical protein
MTALLEVPRAVYQSWSESWSDAPPITRDADSIIVSRDDHRSIFAACRAHNLMQDDAQHFIAGGDLPDASRIVTWSGSLAEDLSEDEPLNFMRRGHEAFHARCTELHEALNAANRRLALVPHHRHLLSDAPSVRAFLDQWAGGPFDILFDPVRLFAKSMYDRADEHAERIFELIAPRAIAWRRPVDGIVPAEVAAAIEAAGRRFDPEGRCEVGVRTTA